MVIENRPAKLHSYPTQSNRFSRDFSQFRDSYQLFEIAGFYRAEILTRGKAEDRWLSTAITRGMTTQPGVKRSSDRVWIVQRVGIRLELARPRAGLPFHQKRAGFAMSLGSLPIPPVRPANRHNPTATTTPDLPSCAADTRLLPPAPAQDFPKTAPPIPDAPSPDHTANRGVLSHPNPPSQPTAAPASIAAEKFPPYASPLPTPDSALPATPPATQPAP